MVFGVSRCKYPGVTSNQGFARFCISVSASLQRSRFFLWVLERKQSKNVLASSADFATRGFGPETIAMYMVRSRTPFAWTRHSSRMPRPILR